jgi:hypothetical protein
MKSKLLSIDNIFEEVRDRVVWIKFKYLNMPKDKPKLNQYLKRLILEYGLKEPIYIQSTLEVSDGYNRLMCLKDIVTDIDEVEIPCIMTTETTNYDIEKREKEFYKMDIDKFRGGRAIPDLEVIELYNEVFDVSHVLTKDDKHDFISLFDNHIQSSKLNQLIGLDGFQHKTFTAGTSQSFDSFWMKYHDRRFRCFEGEFFYHKANWKKFHNWSYLDYDKIKKGDAVIISLPFSDYCTEHPKMKSTLSQCSLLGVPVLIDCAYYGIASGVDFDLSKYDCIKEVTFSLSKTFYNANRLRAGIRYAKDFADDNIDIMNEWGQINHISTYIGKRLLEAFEPDYTFNKFRKRQEEYCKLHNLKPTDCVSFAFGEAGEYDDLNRGTDVNRLCIADQIGDKV